MPSGHLPFAQTLKDRISFQSEGFAGEINKALSNTFWKNKLDWSPASYHRHRIQPPFPVDIKIFLFVPAFQFC